MIKYEIRPGFSITTKVGMAHAGAIIDETYLSGKHAGRYLEEMAGRGKLKKIEDSGEEKKKMKFMRPSKNIEEEKEEKSESKKEIFGGAEKK